MFVLLRLFNSKISLSMFPHRGSAPAHNIAVTSLLWMIGVLCLFLAPFATDQTHCVRNYTVASCNFSGKDLAGSLGTQCNTDCVNSKQGDYLFVSAASLFPSTVVMNDILYDVEKMFASVFNTFCSTNRICHEVLALIAPFSASEQTGSKPRFFTPEVTSECDGDTNTTDGRNELDGPSKHEAWQEIFSPRASIFFFPAMCFVLKKVSSIFRFTVQILVSSPSLVASLIQHRVMSLRRF